jgi:hypothetical protein
MEIFSCRRYYGNWGQYLFQRKYMMLPLGEVLRKKDWLYETLASDGHLFIRPDANNKMFDGELIAVENFELWRLHVEGVIDNHSLCVVSQPRPIDVEWRMFMRRGKVVTGSTYRVNRELDRNGEVPQEVVEFAETVATVPYPDLPPVYALDVAKSEGQLYLMEIGSVNCAGYYGSDVSKIVRAASEEAEIAWQEVQ